MAQLLRCKPEGRGFDSRLCHWHFALTQSSRPLYGLGVGSASSRNEYQEYFLGIKAVYVQQPYHPYVPTVSKSGNLTHLERTGPLQTRTRAVTLLCNKMM